MGMESVGEDILRQVDEEIGERGVNLGDMPRIETLVL